MKIEDKVYKIIVLWDSEDWDIGVARDGNALLKSLGWKYAPTEKCWWKHKMHNPSDDVVKLKELYAEKEESAAKNGTFFTLDEGERIDNEFLRQFRDKKSLYPIA